MNILFVGDIFASPGRRIVADHLQDIVETNRIDLTIANAENSAGGFGITPTIAEELLGLGVDVLTLKQHSGEGRCSWCSLDRPTVALSCCQNGMHHKCWIEWQISKPSECFSCQYPLL